MPTKSTRTKLRLAQALEDLLGEMPLSKITVRAIVERAGTNRQTFYYHFQTIDDLVIFLCSDRLSLLGEAVHRSDGRHALFRELTQQVEEARGVLAPLLAGVGRPAMRKLFFRDAYAILKKEACAMLAQQRVQANEEDVQQCVLYCQYAMATIVIDWINDESPFAFDAEELADFLCTMFERNVDALARECG